MSFRYSNDKNNDFPKKSPTVQNPIKKDKKFFCALGDSFMMKNEYRKALKEYLVSLMIDKNNLTACLGASKAYKNLKEYNKAIKHLKKARNIYGFDSEIYYELGLNYLLCADNQNAQKNFIRTIKLTPDNKNAQLKLALTHELSGEEDMAIMVYKTIIDKYPTYIPAMSSLATLYIENEEFIEAIKIFQKILKINSEYYRAYLGIGLCFDKIGKYVNAVRFYKKYISFKPNSDTTKFLASRIYKIYKDKHDKNNKIKYKENERKFKVISNS